MRNALVKIHLDNIVHNLNEIRGLVGAEVKISASVKADAYGHGALRVARRLQAAGTDFLGIAAADEGEELRRAGIELPILLYGLCPPGGAAKLVGLDISVVVADQESIALYERAAARLGKRARLHLKVDTGMGRIGCTPADAPALAAAVAASRHCLLEGVFTHFSTADSPDRTFTLAQIGLFDSVLKELRGRGIEPSLVHAANSAGVMRYPQAHYAMVRPGILLYGYSPCAEIGPHLDLRPAMELRAAVVFIKRVPAGTPISYGLSYHTPRETCIATIAAGYADGYPRSLSNRGRVLIGGRLYPVVGRVCMDQIMIDVGPEPQVALYDEAVLFGPDPSGPGADEVARLASTIPYEITSLINKRIPRQYLGE